MMLIKVRAGDCEILYEKSDEITTFNPACNGFVGREGKGYRDHETFLNTIRVMAQEVRRIREGKDDE